MAANTNLRLIRLEERVPKGCPACRAWQPTVYQFGSQPPERGEVCHSCGRFEPIAELLHLDMPDGLWEAV